MVNSRNEQQFAMMAKKGGRALRLVGSHVAHSAPVLEKSTGSYPGYQSLHIVSELREIVLHSLLTSLMPSLFHPWQTSAADAVSVLHATYRLRVYGSHFRAPTIQDVQLTYIVAPGGSRVSASSPTANPNLH